MRGPAGFGKTTLMQQWHDELVANGRRVAWVTLDRGDNAAPRLAVHIDAALRGACSFPPSAAPNGERIFEGISRYTEQNETTLILMLDELETVTSEEAVRMIQGLVNLSSSNFSVIAAGRRIPQLGQGRLALQGRVREVNSDILRFDETEVCAMLESRLGARITASQAIQLGAHLEGWAAGLQFAYLALRDKFDVAKFMRHAAKQDAVAEYLRDEVFSQLSDELRQFLLTTSLFTVLTADLCKAVTGRDDCAERLAELEHAGLFLKRVEVGKHVVGYRFHDLFARFLQGQLALRGEAPIREIHRAASAWFADQGLWHEAIDHAVKAGDRENALHLLDAVSMDFLGSGQVEALLTWNSQMKMEEAPHYPYAFASLLWAELSAGHYTLVADRLAEFYSRLGSTEVLAPVLRDNLIGIDIVNSAGADRFNETISKATAALSSGRCLNGFETTPVANVLAIAHLACGGLRAARETLTTSRISVQSSDRTVSRVYTQAVSAMIDMTDLRLADATASMQLALNNAINERGPYSHAAGLCASSLCDLLYEANRISEAEEVIEGRIPNVTRVGWPDCALTINLIASRIATLRQDYERAFQILSNAQAICAHRELPRLMTTLQWEQAHVAFLSGAPDISQSLAQQIQAQHSQYDSPHMTSVEAMTRDIAPIRLALLRKETDRITQNLTRLMAQAKGLGSRRRWLKLCVLRAVSLSLEGKREAALSEMSRALRVGLPAGFIRLFIDEGDVATELIRKVIAQPDMTLRPFVAQIERLQVALNGLPVSSDPVGEFNMKIARNHLTSRELEIIDIAARGLTNAEIGHCLALTEPTVKWHMQKAFRKLGVNNRTEAIFMTRQ